MIAARFPPSLWRGSLYMRRFNVSRFSLSASVFAVTVAWGSPAFAQPETQQQQAQKANTVADCSAIGDAAKRRKCIDTQGTNAQPTSGAPAEGSIVVTG